MIGEMKIVFPHFGNYHIPIAKFVEKTLNIKPFLPFAITKKTIELGAKHSPDFVCVPFKYNLGNYIEALENGANVLIQAGGGCRFGYYGELQEEILKNLGYNFKFYKLTARSLDKLAFYKMLKKINPNLSFGKYVYSAYFLYKHVKLLDEIEDYIRKNIGFEVNIGDFEKLEKKFHCEMKVIKKISDIRKISVKYKKLFKNISIKKPKNCLKVGIVGEFYVLIEPFSNYYIERELAKKGIEVKRYINVFYTAFSKDHRFKKRLKRAKPYILDDIGADGVDSVGHALELTKKGYDGIIHIKPFGCTPEINAIPALQNISNDYNIPILYFSVDSQTSETGVKTRLEAFHDMLLMKKKKE